MFVRTKTTNGKRYLYLVEGKRQADGKVRQKTVAYLGSLVRLSSGVPDEVKKRATLEIDWKQVNEQIRRIPLRFDELVESRQFTLGSETAPGATLGRMRPRADGELEALTALAESGFKEIFEEVGERTYRMR